MKNNHIDNRFKVGIVGLGQYGRLITAVLKKIPDVVLVAACELKPDRLHEVSNEFDIPYPYTDYQDMLLEQQLNAIFVATSENEHVEPVLHALESGAHVFVEKPLATSLVDIDTIGTAAQKTDRQVMVGHILRFDPRLVDIKKRLDSGELGHPVSIFAKRSVTRSLFEMYMRCHPWLMLAIHDLDTALWLLEDIPKTIYAIKRHVWDGKYADAHWALLEMCNGAVVSIESTSCVSKYAQSALDVYTEIVGTEGVAIINGLDGGYLVSNNTRNELPNVIYNYELPDHVIFGALRDEIQYFFDCLTRNAPIQKGTIKQARLAVAVALAAIQSEESQAIVQFDKPDLWQDLSLV